MVPPAVELVPPAVKGIAPSPTASFFAGASEAAMVARAANPPVADSRLPEGAAVSGLMRRDRAAELLDVSERTVRRWGAAGLLDERHIGPRAVRVTETSVLRLIESGARDRHDREEAA